METNELLIRLNPTLRPGSYAVVPVEGSIPAKAIGTFREDEGWCAIVPVNAGDVAGAEASEQEGFVAAWISLGVSSELDQVGLTAAVSAVLAEAGIACNVVAALHHDHLFVPVAEGERALRLLTELSASAREADQRAAIAELNRLRSSIDNLDAAVIHLLAERFKCTQRVGVLKAEHDMPASDPAREARQIERLHVLARDADLDPVFAERFLNFVIAEVIQHHRAAAARQESVPAQS